MAPLPFRYLGFFGIQRVKKGPRGFWDAQIKAGRGKRFIRGGGIEETRSGKLTARSRRGAERRP